MRALFTALCTRLAPWFLPVASLHMKWTERLASCSLRTKTSRQARLHYTPFHIPALANFFISCMYSHVLWRPCVLHTPKHIYSTFCDAACQGGLTSAARKTVIQSILQEAVAAGDLVSFQIADSLKAAKQAEKLGSAISHLVGEC